MSSVKPLLSICIPTFNRADLLRSALWSLIPQIWQARDQAELIVSDNCSSDDTTEVVRWAQTFVPIQYHRNSQNLGPTANFLMMTNKLARGEYGWILGDDDLTRKDAVKNVLDAIRANQTVDYFFVNHSYEHISKRENIGLLVRGSDLSEGTDLLCCERQDHVVSKWEEIIRFSHTPGLFTSIVCSVFRLSSWRKESVKIKFDFDDSYRSLENTFPHVCIIARMMVGKPAVYLSYPHVIFFTGSQGWLGDWPTMLFVHVLELADLFEKLGIDGELVNFYRQNVFEHSAPEFGRLVTHPTELSRTVFSLRRLVARYWRNKSFRKMLWAAIRTQIAQGRNTTTQYLVHV